MKTVVLLTGAGGQLGSELTEALVQKFGAENIIATDINPFDLDAMTKNILKNLR